ncbi:MAG: acyltransferase family protein [Chitinophagaceae bacterium]|nr:acyltransferase family protein [Chitinophagaceae bacterium]
MGKDANRYHGIDALRAFAMILGIFLHASIVYKVNPLPVWPSDPEAARPFFDYLYFFIHTFRMPLFFLVAGFFCRLLLQKAGVRGFIHRRWQRIGIPFLFSLVFILPFTVFPFLVYQQIPVYGHDWGGNFRAAFRQLIGWNGLAHLWFLYYLIIYYVVFVALTLFFKRPGLASPFQFLIRWWERTRMPLFYLGLAGIAVSWLILSMQPHFLIPVYTGLFPSPAHLLFYFFFMWLGWLIHMRPDILEGLQRYGVYLLLAGVLLSVPGFRTEQQEAAGQDFFMTLILAKGLLSLQIVLLVTGFTGFFLRFFSDRSPFWRYLSDAAYWLYLLHMGIVTGWQILFMYLKISPFLEFFCITGITLILTLLSYQYMVRHTLIGVYLHGPRSLGKTHRK